MDIAQLFPLPLTVSCFSKIQVGCTFLVPADPGSPGKRAVKRARVCSCGPNVTSARFGCYANTGDGQIAYMRSHRQVNLSNSFVESTILVSKFC